MSGGMLFFSAKLQTSISPSKAQLFELREHRRVPPSSPDISEAKDERYERQKGCPLTDLN